MPLKWQIMNMVRRPSRSATVALWSLAVAMLMWVPLATAAESTVEATIVGITDGDTVKALVNGHELWKVRLAEIDAPERRQPWGRRAKQALAGMIFGKNVRVRVRGKDHYGRYIGTIHLERRNINRALVRDGHAWVYRKYMKDPSLLREEQAARQAGRGLWSLPEASRTPPWEWRYTRRHGKSRTAPPQRIVIPRPAGPGPGIEHSTETEG